jgi:hypothetical protein
MRTRIAAGVAALTVAALALTGLPLDRAAAQDKKEEKKDKAKEAAPTGPTHLYGHNLRVRKGGDKDFGPETPKVGVEFFRDEATKALIAVSDTGSIAVARAPAVSALGKDRTCKWLTAHDLSCRKAGEAEFSQKTRKFGVELFQDRASNNLLYVCETGTLVLAPVPGGLVTDKGPVWHHALEPKVRTPDQERFDNAKKFGMEVFKDENTGAAPGAGLVLYITETGGLGTAKAPAVRPDPAKVLAPRTQYGLVLRVRGADELNFTDKTKRIGVEVFEDPNAEVLFYISETGAVAVAPRPAAKGKDDAPAARGVTWKGAMALRARKADEAEFDKARKFGIEVFEDNRNGNLIFITETGSIAVLAR